MTMMVKKAVALAVAAGAAATLLNTVSIAQVGNQDLTVQAAVDETCHLRLADGDGWLLDFGAYDVRSLDPVTADFTFEVLCALGLDYHVTIDAGRHAHASGRRRLHTPNYPGTPIDPQGNSMFMLYDLYFENSHAPGAEWTEENYPPAEVGGGAPVAYTVYGRVPARQSIVAGRFEDTVTIAVVIH